MGELIKINDFVDNCYVICDECENRLWEIIVDDPEICNVLAVRCSSCGYTEFFETKPNPECHEK